MSLSIDRLPRAPTLLTQEDVANMVNECASVIPFSISERPATERPPSLQPHAPAAFRPQPRGYRATGDLIQVVPLRGSQLISPRAMAGMQDHQLHRMSLERHGDIHNTPCVRSQFQDSPLLEDESSVLAAVCSMQPFYPQPPVNIFAGFEHIPEENHSAGASSNGASPGIGVNVTFHKSHRESALGLISRVAAKVDEQTRQRIIDSVVVTEPAVPQPHGWLQPATTLMGLTRGASEVVGYDGIVGDKIEDGLLYSAVHNPLFGILNNEVPFKTRSCSASTDLGPEIVLLTRVCVMDSALAVLGRVTLESEAEKTHVPASVWGLSATNAFRSRIIAVTESTFFDWTMTAAILTSCVMMAMEHPRIPVGSNLMAVLEVSNLVLTIVFGIECLLKIITFGPITYWRKTSNKVDLSIVIFAVFLLLFENSGLSFVKSLRTLRALKALRVATRSNSMQQLINSIVFSVSSMLNVTLLLLVCVIIFAILGVQLFSGLFYRCNDGTVAGVEECIGSFINSVGEEVPRVWLNGFYNFDSLFRALLSLFVVSTLEGYSTIMQSGIAAPPAKGMQPRPGGNPYNALFFVAYVLVAVFVMLNLYVGACCLSCCHTCGGGCACGAGAAPPRSHALEGHDEQSFSSRAEARIDLDDLELLSTVLLGSLCWTQGFRGWITQDLDM
jgi:hypothetical protein